MLLDARGVVKRFGGLVAVNGPDIAVAQGELVGLFGPNGAGKTTLFNLVAGVYGPDAGRIIFRGNDVTRQPAFRRARAGIGRTFQVVRPFRELTVLENLLAVVPSDAAPSGALDAFEVLQWVRLDERAQHAAGDLTLGMLKRLEVARALMLAPRLLLLDEPLAGLTDREASEMLALIAGMKARAAVVMVEHNVRLALPICDRAIVMDAGSVIAEGTPAEIRQNPAVVRAYLGGEAE